MLPLSELPPGQCGVIRQLSGPVAVRQRLYEFGLLEGELVEVIRLAPLGDPMEIRIGQTHLSLRRAEAAHILTDPMPLCQSSTDQA
jgi:ferrous iron transport protein A